MIRLLHGHHVKLILALLFIAGWTSAVIASESTVPATGEITADDVNVRGGNNRNYEVLSQGHRGDAITILEQQGEWYRIILPQTATCYINAAFVELRPDQSRGTVTGDRVNLRARPATSSSIVGQAYEGEQVTTRNRDGDWLAIAPPAVASGWVHSQFVKIIGPVVTPTTTAVAPPTSSTTESTSSLPTVASTAKERITTTSSTPVTTTAAEVNADKPSVPSLVQEIQPNQNITPALPDLATPSATTHLTGAIEDLGRLVARPARHKLIRDRRVVAFLVSERYDLNRFLHRPVLLWGDTMSSNSQRIPLVRVDRIEPSPKLQ